MNEKRYIGVNVLLEQPETINLLEEILQRIKRIVPFSHVSNRYLED